MPYVGYSSFEDKLQSNTIPEPNTGCWLWIGNRMRNGYGTTNVRVSRGKHAVQLAHRIVWEAHRGAVPDGLQLDHLCRVRSCVNPWHLEPVTRKENILRGVSPTAANARKTHCPLGHAYTPDNMYLRGDRPGRMCRQCRIQKAREWRQRPRTAP